MPEYTFTISIHGGVGSLDGPTVNPQPNLAPGDRLTIRLIDYDVDTLHDEVEYDDDGDPFITVDETSLKVVYA